MPCLTDLAEIRKRLLASLKRLHVLQQSLRKAPEAGKLLDPKTKRDGEAYRVARWNFENHILEMLPRPVCEALQPFGTAAKPWPFIHFVYRTKRNMRQIRQKYLKEHVLSGSRTKAAALQDCDEYFERVQSGGGLSFSQWDCEYPAVRRCGSCFVDLFTDKKYKLVSPSVTPAIGHVRSVLDRFMNEGRTDFSPTEAEIETAILEHVKAEHPAWLKESLDEADNLALLDGTQEPPMRLSSAGLRAAVADEFKPCEVSSERMNDVLKWLRQNRKVHRYPLAYWGERGETIRGLFWGLPPTIAARGPGDQIVTGVAKAELNSATSVASSVPGDGGDKQPGNAGTKPARRRRAKAETRPLTEKQTQVFQAVGENKGNVAAAARALGLDYSTVKQHLDAANKKLGRKAVAKPRTTRQRRDRRGQETETGDARLG